MSQSNGQQTITAGSWTNIGTGPLTINLQSLSLSVNVVVSDTQPADNAQGNILSQSRPSMQVSNAQAVWVRGVPSWTNSSGTAIIDVLLGTPGASGGSSGDVKKFISSPAVSTTAYAAGQVVGGLIELQNAGKTSGGSGTLLSAMLDLNITNAVQFDLVLFSSQPSTLADKATYALSQSDQQKILRVMHITDWTANGSAASTGKSPSEPDYYTCDDGTKTTSLWAYLVARGAVTFNNATDATITMRVARN